MSFHQSILWLGSQTEATMELQSILMLVGTELGLRALGMLCATGEVHDDCYTP